MINSRKYLNDTLVQHALSRSPNAPAVVDPSRLAAAHATEQAQTQNQMRQAEQSLGLGQRRLDLNRQGIDFSNQQARDSLGLRRNDFEANKTLAGTANLINTANLGVNAFGAYRQMKNTDETIAAINNFADSMQGANDQTKNFFKILMQKRMAYNG
jgi:hypothetical protein